MMTPRENSVATQGSLSCHLAGSCEPTLVDAKSTPIDAHLGFQRGSVSIEEVMQQTLRHIFC
eukprot:1118904-Pyramimonas_sp.AAC.1